MTQKRVATEFSWVVKSRLAVHGIILQFEAKTKNCLETENDMKLTLGKGVHKLNDHDLNFIIVDLLLYVPWLHGKFDWSVTQVLLRITMVKFSRLIK